MDYWKRLRESGVRDDLLILPGANVFIENDKGEILLGREVRNNLWQNIGGLAKDNEALWQCAVREAKEEIGLNIKNLIPFCFRDDPREKKDFGTNKCFFQTLSFWTKDYEGEISFNDKEISEKKWVDLKKIELDCLPITRRFIQAFLEWKKTGQFQYLTNN